MAEYFTALQSTRLPLPLWGVVVLWCLLYLVSFALTRAQRSVLKAHPQNLIATGEPTGQIREQSWRLACVQVLLTAAIFTSAYFLGEPAFVFLAGGWLVTTAVSIPLALRRILFNRALAAPGAASGSVTLSYDLIIQSVAFELLGAAAFVLVLGICLSHSALLGGALFIGATGLGYLRKTRRIEPKNAQKSAATGTKGSAP